MIRFTEEHEWLRKEDGVITVGITEYASARLGRIVFVELPEPGAQVLREDEIVVIESVKAAATILAPLDGEIVAVNHALISAPGRVNADPSGDGWFLKMRAADESQWENFMDEARYQSFIS